MPRPTEWTPEQEKYLTDHYLTDDVKDVAIHLNRTVAAIKNRVAGMPDLYKRKAYRQLKPATKKMAYQKALPIDRWQDAEDFINLMGKLRDNIKRNNLVVNQFNFMDALPKSFSQYQCEIGR